MPLPLTILLVFGTAKFSANICERFRQPGLVGEIVAGVLLGPSLLNWIHPSDVLSALAELGLLFLLFRVGLEVKASDLLKVGRVALLVAVLGVAIPFVLGAAVMVLAGASRLESIFVGAALVATSIGVTAQVLASKGLLEERASQIILAAAIIDDILGLLVLAVVSSVAHGRINMLSLAATAVLAVGFSFFVAKYGSRTAQRVLPRLEAHLPVQERRFHLALVLLFALAVAAAYVGIAAIVGAFLAGLTLSETADQRVRDLAHGITELLVPFFLVGIGLHLDLSVFASPKTVMLAAAICSVAVFSKLIGGAAGAWSLGRTDMLRVGVGMIPRGEVGMVVAQIGLSFAVIEKPVYAVLVFMAIATTLVAPLGLNYAYRDCRPQNRTLPELGAFD